MTKDTLETANYLAERIKTVQYEVDSIQKLANSTKEISVTNFEYHVVIALTVEEKELILPLLLKRKTEQLKLLQEEFESL